MEKHQAVPQLIELVRAGQAMMVCPEVLGGLPIPREPAEIVGGDGVDVWAQRAKVVTISGEDVTEQFTKGAKIAYQKLQEQGITQLILKEKSPSCGSQTIYDGNFSGIKNRGRCRLCLFSTTRHDCFVRCRMACKTGGSKWKLKRPIA